MEQADHFLEWRVADKSDFGPGPWQDEPDKRQWKDADTGLPCLMVRNSLGALCGYVGVSPDHPWHGINYSAPAPVSKSLALNMCRFPDLYEAEIEAAAMTPESLLTAHGGITFSGPCQEGTDPAEGICHIPGDGEPDDIWWFGFDCAHAGDLAPGLGARYQRLSRGDTYRDVDYVAAECVALAAQLVRVSQPHP